jgi:hypothetical protein
MKYAEADTPNVIPPVSLCGVSIIILINQAEQRKDI